MQCKDIPDWEVYRAIPQVQKYGLGVTFWGMQAALPQYPDWLVRAKLSLMVRRGRLFGCSCGCRGDFRFPLPECSRYGLPDPDWEVRLRDYLKTHKRGERYG